MFQLSEYIYGIINVVSVINEASGGVWPLLADQDSKDFITYSFGFDASLSKNNRNRYQLIIKCYGVGYDKALKMHDAVESVLTAVDGIYMDGLESGYVDDTNEAVVISVYTLRK